MTTNVETESFTGVVELSPNYRIPIFLLIKACLLFFASSWLAGVLSLVFLCSAVAIALLGSFLTVQTVLIRLQFTDQALNVLRSGKQILSFPYSEWLNWEIYWFPVPILFYFREINSIHFLPIIFDPKTLVECLNKHYPR